MLLLSSIPTATSLYCLLLVALVTCPTRCDPNEQNWEELNEMQVEALSAQLSVTAQATPTPLWAVDWGPTQTLEDETQHFLPSQEGDHWQASTDETLPHHKNTLTTHTQQQLPSLEAKDVVTGKDSKTEAEEEFEEGGHGWVKRPVRSLERAFCSSKKRNKAPNLVLLTHGSVLPTMHASGAL